MNRWYLWHKWSSLICTAFLLVLCVSGLPLIFEDEIEELGGTRAPLPALADDAAAAPARLADIVAAARARYPGEHLRFMNWDRDQPRRLTLNMAATPDAPAAQGHTLEFDAASGKLLEEQPQKRGLLQFMLDLHRNLFAGLAGDLLLCAMGLLFVVAIVSGVALYGPFMRKLEFGAVRHARTARIRWLDLHNLLGVSVLAWTLVVGLTGVINTLSTPLFALWSARELPHLMQAGRGQAPPAVLAPVDEVVRAAHAALPGRRISGLVFPNARFGSPRHYILWTLGDTPLTSRLFRPVLADGENGQLVYSSELPWYLKALELSRPLHFGDYGGLPLKILWALLDLITIVVLGSGIYLWLGRLKQGRAGA